MWPNTLTLRQTGEDWVGRAGKFNITGGEPWRSLGEEKAYGTQATKPAEERKYRVVCYPLCYGQAGQP